MVQDVVYSLPVPPQSATTARRPQRSSIVPMTNNSVFTPRPPSAVLPTKVACECHQHNSRAVASNATPLTITLQEAGQKDVVVNADFFPMTAALRCVLESAEKGACTVEISVRQLCKLYDDGKCRHRLRCKNVHICPVKRAEIVASQNEAAALAAAATVLEKKESFIEERPTLSTSPMPHPPKCDSPSKSAPAFRRLTSVERDSNPTTKCLARFVRRWNNPNVANSGDSNLSSLSLSADNTCSRSSIPKLPPIFMSRELQCSSPMIRTPTPADECSFFGIAC